MQYSVLMTKKYSVNLLINKLRLLLALTVLIVSFFFVGLAYNSNIEAAKESVGNKIEAITRTLSFQIKGEDHLYLLNNYQKKDAIKKNNQDSVYHKIQKLLKHSKEVNKLNSTVYTMVLDSSTLQLEKPILKFLVASSDEPFFMHSFSTYPEEELKKFTEGGVLAPYEDENGSWISAFHPILTSDGKPVGIVQADVEFDEFIENARLSALKQMVLIPFILTLVFLIANRVLKLIIHREEEFGNLEVNLKESDEAKILAEKALKEQELFLAKVSHEMRTPLNGIIGLSELINKSKLSKEEQRDLELVIDSGKDLLLIINDLLDLSKIDSGNLQLELSTFRFKKEISKSVELLKPKTQEKGIQLDFRLAEELDVNVIGDVLRIKQVVFNLLSNAIKFTPDDGVIEVYADCLVNQPTSKTIRIGVKDNGVGIEESKFNLIFESFKQEDNSIARKFGGTGLGLSICKYIVEKLGGEIQLESEKGKGSHFYFDFELEVSADKENLNLELKTGQKYLDAINVLIAEDNVINQKIARNILTKFGANVTIVENGKEAVEIVQAKSFDLVLMDIQMPIMGGEEAFICIREELKMAIPVIALTANALENERTRFLNLGMNGYLSKPFDPDELIKRILMLLDIESVEAHVDNNSSLPQKEVEDNELYDLSTLISISGDDMEFVKDILSTYINECDNYLEQLQDFYENKKWEQLGKLAHKFNSSVDSIGIKNGKTILKNIELECRGEKNEGNIKGNLDLITNIAIEVKRSLVEQYF